MPFALPFCLHQEGVRHAEQAAEFHGSVVSESGTWLDPPGAQWTPGTFIYFLMDSRLAQASLFSPLFLPLPLFPSQAVIHSSHWVLATDVTGVYHWIYCINGGTKAQGQKLSS